MKNRMTRGTHAMNIENCCAAQVAMSSKGGYYLGKRARAAQQDRSGDQRKTAVASQRRVTTAATQLAAGGLGAGVAPPSRRRQCSGRFAGVWGGVAPPAAGGSPAHSSHSPHASVIELQAAAGQAAVLLQPDQRLLASDDVLYPLPLLEKV